MSSFTSITAFEAALTDLPEADQSAAAAATARQRELTKPPGSLGRLEDIAIFMAGWQARPCPVLKRGRTAVFAANHGFVVHGVSAFPASVTAAMVNNFAAGGAAINALAGMSELELKVVALDLDRPTLDFTSAAAMDADECLEALAAGAEVVTADLNILTVGEMGIGNTTAAAALCARSLGGTASAWVGPGTGIDASGIARKTKVVDQALAFHGSAPKTPFETLRRLGGREIAAVAGAVLRARQLRVPVVLDGFITCAAIAPLAAAVPKFTDHCIAGHVSAEPGHHLLLQHLGLTPLLSLGMRLGEGSGGALAVSIIRSALAVHAQMATFAEAGVAGSL